MGIGVPSSKTHAAVVSPITEDGGTTVTVMGEASFQETGS